MKLFTISTFVILFLIASLNELKAQELTESGARTIYLIRHGEYDIDDERDPDLGKEIVPLGIAQARLLSTRLKSMDVEFTSLTSSTMTRARQTAMIINKYFPELNLKQSRLIRECTPPTWREDIMADESESDLNECITNLEKSFEEFFIPSSDEKDKHDIIVCHGNVIRYFVTKALKVDTLAWLQMAIGNCSLTIVKIRPNGSIKLVSYNDLGHIPSSMQTLTGGENKSKSLVLPGE